MKQVMTVLAVCCAVVGWQAWEASPPSGETTSASAGAFSAGLSSDSSAVVAANEAPASHGESALFDGAEPDQNCGELTGDAMKPGCKPCKDRPWCGCSYNGAPRLSCDPCCYDTFPYPTCLD